MYLCSVISVLSNYDRCQLVFFLWIDTGINFLLLICLLFVTPPVIFLPSTHPKWVLSVKMIVGLSLHKIIFG